jgi:hypothetical protein
MAKKKVTYNTNGFIISNPDFESIRKYKHLNLELLRVTVTNAETKIDFGYQAGVEYDFGEWIKINPKTFIRTYNSDKSKAEFIGTFFLNNATNIPYGPEKYHFSSRNEGRFFSLHFDPIPIDTIMIDLIEEIDGKITDFNFYKIHLAKKENRCEIY